MKRAPAVIGATGAGLALVLTFHTHPISTKITSKGSPTEPDTTTGPTTTGPTTTGPTTTGPTTTGPSPTGPSTTEPTSARTLTGDDVQYRYGDIQLQVTETGSRITNVSILQNGADDPHSAQINSQAVPLLESETLSAGSAQIDGVSGATYTSQAYVESLQSALDQVNG